MKSQPTTRKRLRWIKTSPVATPSKTNYQYHLTITEAQQGEEDGDITMLDAQHNTTAQQDKQHVTTPPKRQQQGTNREKQPHQQAKRNSSTTKEDQPESETPMQPLHRYGTHLSL